jgi:ABC-2 type transport system permease protein
MTSSLAYLAALLGANLRAAFARPVAALVAALFMLGNNLILYVVWVIYFANFSNLRGWVAADLALLLGVVAWAFGLAVLVAGGGREIAQQVADGTLDVHLGRPRHPLPSLLASRSLPSGLGDMASAPVFWLVFADRGIGDVAFLLLVATAAAGVIVATMIATQSLAFWLPRAATLCEELFQMFLMVCFYPQHPFAFTIRLVLFTLVPAAFVALLPVEAVREGSVLKALAVLGGAVVYMAIATAIFARGLRRYASGNRMIEWR